MIRILQINGHAIMNRGVEKYLLDVYKEIDKKHFQFDFMTPLVCQNDDFKALVERMGGKIIELNGSDNKILNKLTPFKIWAYLIKHKYDIVHIHTGNVMLMGLFAMAAKLAGIKRVLVHAHNSADMKTGLSVKNYKNFFAEILMTLFCDGYYGCSLKAVQFMFPKRVFKTNNYSIIPNGIQVKDYCYSAEKRMKIRTELGLRKEYLLGCIGAFVDQKNHRFLIEVMRALKDKGCEAKLLLVGEGPLETKIRDYCEKQGVGNDVIFYGTTNRIPAILSALDVLLMPSLYEGFPVVGVEAQAAGLRCLLSNHITSEIKLTDSLIMLSIDSPDAVNLWANCIVSLDINDPDIRVRINNFIQKSDYQISNSAIKFEHIYRGC